MAAWLVGTFELLVARGEGGGGLPQIPGPLPDPRGIRHFYSTGNSAVAVVEFRVPHALTQGVVEVLLVVPQHPRELPQLLVGGGGKLGPKAQGRKEIKKSCTYRSEDIW